MPAVAAVGPEKIKIHVLLSKTSTLRFEIYCQKILNLGTDFGGMSFEGKMPGVIEHDFGKRVVSAIGLRSGRKKERIILSPHCQGWRLIFAEKFLKLGIKLHVVFVIADEVELDL